MRNPQIQYQLVCEAYRRWNEFLFFSFTNSSVISICFSLLRIQLVPTFKIPFFHMREIVLPPLLRIFNLFYTIFKTENSFSKSLIRPNNSTILILISKGNIFHIVLDISASFYNVTTPNPLFNNCKQILNFRSYFFDPCNLRHKR